MIFFGRRTAVDRVAARIELQPVGGRLNLGELTVNNSGDDTRAAALLQNISYLSQTIQQLQVATISYINFAGLVSIGALTVGVIQRQPLIEIFAPYGLSTVLVFLLQLYTDIERLVTIKEVLEAHVNSVIPAPAFLGLNRLSSKYRGRTSVRFVSVLLAIPLVLFGYHSIAATARLVRTAAMAERWWRRDLFYLNWIGLGFCLTVILWAGWEMIRAHRIALLETKETLGDLPNVTG